MCSRIAAARRFSDATRRPASAPCRTELHLLVTDSSQELLGKCTYSIQHDRAYVIVTFSEYYRGSVWSGSYAMMLAQRSNMGHTRWQGETRRSENERKLQTSYNYIGLITKSCTAAQGQFLQQETLLSLVFLAPLQHFLTSLDIAHRGVESLRDGCNHQITVPRFSGGVYGIHDTGIHLLQLFDCET